MNGDWDHALSSSRPDWAGCLNWSALPGLPLRVAQGSPCHPTGEDLSVGTPALGSFQNYFKPSRQLLVLALLSALTGRTPYWVVVPSIPSAAARSMLGYSRPLPP
jgi:hypothetical protein